MAIGNYVGLAEKLSELTGYKLSAGNLTKFRTPYHNPALAKSDNVNLIGYSEYFSEKRFGVTFELSLKHKCFTEHFVVQTIHSENVCEANKTIKETLNVLIDMLQTPIDETGVRNIPKGFSSKKFEYMSFNT